MPVISSDNDYLTVVNLFGTDSPDKQDRLLGAMQEIVDTAAYPGWISSTVHSGQDKYGTANFIQWRSSEDLEARYRGEEFRHHTVPLFSELTNYLNLLQTKVTFTYQMSTLGDEIEISPERDDYVVIEVLGVAPEDQGELIAALEQSPAWLAESPGFRSYSVLRGLRAKGVGHGAGVPLTESGLPDGGFVVVYSQWDGKDSYDSFRTLPVNRHPAGRQKLQGRLDTLLVSNDWNTYRVWHSRSAGQ